VQLGACGLQWPVKGELSDQCTQDEIDEHRPYTYDQATTFFTCRHAPWAKCAMYGDPHVATFDRPHAGADCPTTPKQRDGKKQTVKEQGKYSLVRLPNNVGGLVRERNVHVIGKYGYTAQHRDVSNTKGVAVEGRWLGGNALVVELNGNGNILVKWGPPKNQEVIWRVSASAPVLREKTYDESHRLFAQLTWVTNKLSSVDKAKETKYPLLYFALRDPSGQDFLRLFVQGLRVDKPAEERFLDVIVTMQKDYAKEQDGICGNFNGNAKDDALSPEQMQALQVHTNLFRVPFDFSGPASSPGSFSESEVAEFRKRCKEHKVAKGLRQGCAEDIAALTVQDDEAIQGVINGYQVFSTAWSATR